MVDGKNFIMALLAWEEMRHQTVNKIFIRRMDFTMRRNGVVTKGRFDLIWSETAEGSMTICDSFKDWRSAYLAFRYHASFCSHGYVNLRFAPTFWERSVNVVQRVSEDGKIGTKWYDGPMLVTEGDCDDSMYPRSSSSRL